MGYRASCLGLPDFITLLTNSFLYQLSDYGIGLDAGVYLDYQGLGAVPCYQLEYHEEWDMSVCCSVSDKATFFKDGCAVTVKIKMILYSSQGYLASIYRGLSCICWYGEKIYGRVYGLWTGFCWCYGGPAYLCWSLCSVCIDCWTSGTFLGG